MVLAGIKVVDTPLVHEAIELVRNSSEPYLFNHAMRSWSFGVVIAEGTKPAPDPELLAVSAILHDLGLTDRYSAQERFELDGQKPTTSYDNCLRDIGTRYVEGYTAPTFADLFENAAFTE